MDRDGIGQFQLFQLPEAVIHKLPLIKFHGKEFGEQINLAYNSRIAVKHSRSLVNRNSVPVTEPPFDLIVILYLHNLVTQTEKRSCRLFLRLIRGRRI